MNALNNIIWCGIFLLGVNIKTKILTLN